NFLSVLGFGNWNLGFPVPSGYPVSPPHLTADAPVANVFQPLRVNLFPVRWKKPDQMIPHDCQRFFCFRVTQEPLLTDARLDGHVAAVAKPYVILVWFRFRQKSPRLQQLRRLFPRFEAFQSVQLW